MNNSISIINLDTINLDTIQRTANRIIETSEEKTADSFLLQAEKQLLSSYIALIFLTFPKEEWNFETLVALINASEYREDDRNFKNPVDYAFYYLEKWIKNSWRGNEKSEGKNKDYIFLKRYPIPSDAFEIHRIEKAIKLYKEYKLTAGINHKQIQASCLVHIAEFQEKEKMNGNSPLLLHRFYSLKQVIGN